MKRIKNILQLVMLVLLIQACQAVILKPEAERLYQNAVRNFSTHRDSTAYYRKQFSIYAKKYPCLYNELKGNAYYSQLKYDSACIAYKSAIENQKKFKHKYLLILRAANTAYLAHESQECDSLLDLAKSMLHSKDTISYGRYLGTKGIISNRKKAYKISSELLTHALQYLSKDSLNTAYVFYLNYKGIACQKQGNKVEGLQYVLRSLQLAKKLNMHYVMSAVYFNLAKLYRETEQYKQAEDVYFDYLQYTEKHQKRYENWKALDGIAILYAEQKKYEKAEEFFMKALTAADKINRISTKAVALTNVGRFYRLWNKKQKAKEYLNQALKLRIDHNIKGLSLIRNLVELSEIALKEKQYEATEHFLMKALTLADSVGHLKMQVACQKNLAIMYYEQKNFAKSTRALFKYSRLEKKLQEQNQNADLQRILTEYDNKGKEVQITEQAYKIQIQTVVIVLLVLGVLGISVLAFFFRRLLRQQKEYNKELNELKKDHNEHRNIKSKSPKTEQNSKAQALSRLQDLLEEDVFRDKTLSLKSLAQLLGTNTTYLSEIINNEFECNFKTFLARYRVEWCKRQLIYGEYTSIKQLAFDAGFSSTSAFYATFKTETSMTPAVYKRKFKA
jgi:AraC-like DNA-binding protein